MPDHIPNEAKLIETLREYIKSTPFRSGWKITSPEQRSSIAVASRRLNAVLRSCKISREDAFLKYGPTI